MINDMDCTKGNVTIDELILMLDSVPVGSDVTVFVKRDEDPAPPPRSNNNSANNHPPPPGVTDGGVWGTNVHCGVGSCAVACIFFIFCGVLSSLAVFCVPFDARRVYRVSNTNKVYGPTGELVGVGGGVNFQEGELNGLGGST
jgi:hypothetical protein